MYVPNIRSPKYTKQILTVLKKVLDNNSIIEVDFKTHIQQWIDHPDRKKVNKGIF